MTTSGGPAVGIEQREFARIEVSFPVSLQPLDPQRADRLRDQLLICPSVWAPSNDAALRELATSCSGGHESTLAQAILELSAQLVQLRSRMPGGDGPVKSGAVLQLSGGGGQLKTDMPLARDDLFEILFDENDEGMPPIRAMGQVVHLGRQPGICGFRFAAMNTRDHDLLIRSIYQLQRRMLRRANRHR